MEVTYGQYWLNNDLPSVRGQYYFKGSQRVLFLSFYMVSQPAEDETLVAIWRVKSLK
jgi:hypothetical protein